jgi:hypothetical protein
LEGYGISPTSNPARSLKLMTKTTLTEEETKTLVSLLDKLEPGFLPYDIFVQIARLVVLSIIEFVPLRLNNKGEVEVLLLSRGADDPIWSNELHVPGTVIRPTDTEGKIYLAFDRIFKDELQDTKTSNPHYVGSNLHPSKRGMEQAQIFWVEVLGEPTTGHFYPISQLPDNLIASQLNFIKQAATSFLQEKG